MSLNARHYAKLPDMSMTKDLIPLRYRVSTSLVILMLCLSACLPTSLTDWISPDIEETTFTTLTVAVSSSGEAGDAMLQTLIDEYTEIWNESAAAAGEAIRVRIQLQIVPQYMRSLSSLLADDNPPDLFLVDTFTLPRFVEDGSLLPLTESSNSRLSSSTLDDLYPEIQAAFSINSVLYCLPREYTTLALIYNQTLFDVASVAYPNASWGWSDLQNAAQQITESPNDFYSTFGMVLDADFSRWLPFLHQAGGRVTDSEQTQVTIDSAEALQSLEFYLGFNLDGYAVEPSDLSSTWGGEAFGFGRVGMIIEGSWVVDFLAQEYPDLDYGISPLPRGSAQNATVLFGNCYGIHARSPNQGEALGLAEYLISAQAMARWQAISTLLPARISLEEQILAVSPQKAAFIEGLNYAVPWQLPIGFDSVIDAMNGSMQQVFDAEIDAAEVLRVGQVIGSEILDNEE